MRISFSNDFNRKFFRDYLESIQISIRTYGNDFAIKVGKFNKGSEFLENEQKELKENDLAEINYARYEIRNILYSSFVISLFSFIETQLISLCDVLQKNKGQLFGHRDVKGNEIRYIERLLKKKFLADESLRMKLYIATSIRNSIVHKNNYISSSDIVKIEKYLKESPRSFRLDKDNLIILNDRYLVDLINLSEEIVLEISKYRKKYY